MKERLIKIKLERMSRPIDADWKIKSVVGAITLQDPQNPRKTFRAGDYVIDEVAQRWVDAYRTYEVTCTD